MNEEVEIIPKLLEAIELQNQKALISLVETIHSADLALLFPDLQEDQQQFFCTHTPLETFSEILSELPESLLERSLDFFSKDQQRSILSFLSDDDRVDILQTVSEERKKTLFNLIDESDKEITQSLLKFPEDTAGGRMTTLFPKVKKELTVRQALDYLKKDKEDAESFARIFVTDLQEKLIGVLRFRDLAFSTWDTPVLDIMLPAEHFILASSDQEEAAQMVSKYDLLVLPVVDELDRLLGIITHDDALTIIEQESTEDIEKMAGFTGVTSEDTYLNTPISTHFKRRFPWLFILALLSITSGVVMLNFEEVLNSFFLLALFLPMVVAAGGNTGGQASTMIIRAMSLGELDISSVLKVMWKELKLGLFLGSLLGVSIAIVILCIIPLFGVHLPIEITPVQFSLTIALSISLQIITSALVGALLPLGASAIKIDPAIVAAPIITTVVDVSGLIIYFFVAKTVLGI